MRHDEQDAIHSVVEDAWRRMDAARGLGRGLHAPTPAGPARRAGRFHRWNDEATGEGDRVAALDAIAAGIADLASIAVARHLARSLPTGGRR